MKVICLLFLCLAHFLPTSAVEHTKADTLLNGTTRFVVLDKQTRRPIDSVKVSIKYLNNDLVAITLFTDSNGIAITKLQNEAWYKLSFTRHSDNEDSASYSTMVDAYQKRRAVVTDTIALWPFKTIVEAGHIPYLFYERNSHSTKDTATLNFCLEILKENPDIKMEVVGYSDCKGSKQAIMLISKKRAEAVVEYFTRNGIDKNRLSAKALGDIWPLNGCACRDISSTPCTEEMHGQNRRVSIIVAAAK